MNENKMDYAQTVQNCQVPEEPQIMPNNKIRLCWISLTFYTEQDKLVLGKKPDSDSPPREKPTIESVEAARAKLSATAVRIQQKCHNVNQGRHEIKHIHIHKCIH